MHSQDMLSQSSLEEDPLHLSSLDSLSLSPYPAPQSLTRLPFPPSTGQNIIAGEGLGISDKLISLDVSSPNVPDLTLIDLPGITRVAVGNQPADIGRQVRLHSDPHWAARGTGVCPGLCLGGTLWRRE